MLTIDPWNQYVKYKTIDIETFMSTIDYWNLYVKYWPLKHVCNSLEKFLSDDVTHSWLNFQQWKDYFYWSIQLSSHLVVPVLSIHCQTIRRTVFCFLCWFRTYHEALCEATLVSQLPSELQLQCKMQSSQQSHIILQKANMKFINSSFIKERLEAQRSWK